MDPAWDAIRQLRPTHARCHPEDPKRSKGQKDLRSLFPFCPARNVPMADHRQLPPTRARCHPEDPKRSKGQKDLRVLFPFCPARNVPMADHRFLTQLTRAVIPSGAPWGPSLP